MNRDEFRQHMNNYKKARESNPSLSYWQWKTNKYQDGTDGIVDELKSNSRTILTPEEQQYLLSKSRQRQRMSGAITPMFDIQDAADLTPIGDILTARDTYNAFKDQDYIRASAMLGLMLAPPALGKIAKEKIPSFVTAAADKINELRRRERRQKELDTKIFSQGIEDRNRIIEELYDTPGIWDRAYNADITYGTNYVDTYDNLINNYYSNYFNLPEPVRKDIGDAQAMMSAKPEAIRRYNDEGIPASWSDFAYYINPSIENLDKALTRHEMGHYVDFNMSKSNNADRGNFMFNELRKDLSVDSNPLMPNQTDYFRQGTEQKSYMNTLRQFMFDNNMINRIDDQVTQKQIKEAINKLPSELKSVKAAYQQFKSPKKYTKWFNTIPLLGIPGAVMYSGNKEDNSYAEGSDGVMQSYLLPEIVVTPSEYQNYYMKNIRPKGMPKGEYFLRGLLPEFRTNITKEEQDKILKNLIDVYEYAGKPTINYDGFRDTAYYIPLFNSINSIKDTSDLLAELAHPIQRKIGKNNNFIRDGIKNAINRMTGKNTHYVDKNNYEYETHRIIEPKLRQYIRNGNGNLSEYLQK